MAELRLDPVEKHAVVIAPERNKRPKDVWDKSKNVSSKCPFCPGNESLTPPETFRIKDNFDKWTVRTFPNKYPAFKDSSDDISGIQEVIVESVDHNLNMGSYSERHLEDILFTYKNRVELFKEKKNIKYIVVFKNDGDYAGATLMHPHSQIVGLNKVPAKIREKTKALQKLYKKNNECFYCLLGKHSNRIFENQSFISFIPETAKFSYECWIVPKIHMANYEDISSNQISDLAKIMIKLLKSINRFLKYPALNLILNTGYNKKHENFFHWNMQLIPRTTQVAGFEMASGLYVNQIRPDQAAKTLKKVI